MPSSTLDGLADAYARVSRGNAAALEQFHDLAALLERAQIPFLILKGLDVLIRLYGIRGTRPLADVDLLVRDSDLSMIDRILTEAGYRPQIDGNPCYTSPGNGLAFDLVTTLWYLDEQGLAELWRNARLHVLPQRTVSLLAPEDLLIHLTAYAVIHRGAFTAAWEQDLRLLLLRDRIDWESVASKSRQHALATPLFYGLTWLHQRMPDLPIPASTLHALAPAGVFDRGLLWLLGSLVTSRPIPEIGHLLIWLTKPTGQKWSWIFHTLFPSRPFLTYRYGAAATGRPILTRCRRIIGLASSGLILAARIIRRLASRPMRSPA